MSHTDAIDPAMVTPSQKPIPSTPARQLPLPGLRGHTPPSAFERPLSEKTPRPTLDRPPPRQRRRTPPPNNHPGKDDAPYPEGPLFRTKMGAPRPPQRPTPAERRPPPDPTVHVPD
ncbi:hypothetical protein GCM10027203_09480 [Nonomuraea fastidiosa]